MGTLNFVVQNKNWKFACFVYAYADGAELMKIPIDRAVYFARKVGNNWDIRRGV